MTCSRAHRLSVMRGEWISLTWGSGLIPCFCPSCLYTFPDPGQNSHQEFLGGGGSTFTVWPPLASCPVSCLPSVACKLAPFSHRVHTEEERQDTTWWAGKGPTLSSRSVSHLQPRELHLAIHRALPAEGQVGRMQNSPVSPS